MSSRKGEKRRYQPLEDNLGQKSSLSSLHESGEMGGSPTRAREPGEMTGPEMAGTEPGQRESSLDLLVTAACYPGPTSMMTRMTIYN